LHCAESTARWLIEEIDAGRQPTEGETHEFFTVQWRQTEFFQSRDAIPPQDYNHQVEEGVRACSCVRNLIWRCEILQNVSPYALLVDGMTISGEYAVLYSPRRKIKTFIPYFRYDHLKPVIPDIVTFARWMDASNRLPMTINIVHCPVNQNRAAGYQPDPVRAGEYLRAAVGTISRRPYPRMSEHCLVCPTPNCLAYGISFP